MSIDKDLLDQPMEGRSPGDLFGKEGVPAHLTKALAEPALRVELDEHLAEVEHRDLAAKYPAPAANRRRAWTEGVPFLDDPPEGREPIHTRDRDRGAALEAAGRFGPGDSSQATKPRRNRSISRRLRPLGSGRGTCDSGGP